MYLDLDANDNLSEPCLATFKETGPAQPTCAVHLWRDNVWQWCAITGWNDDAPAPAYRSPIEESGDGPALLLHGGNQGLRLAIINGPECAATVHWALSASEQWGEPFLIVRPGTAFA